MQKEFNKVKPYCYFISRKKDSAFYFGVRYRNIRFNRTPNEDFAKFYFTSGRLKKEFESNISNFNYRLVYTFDTVKEAQEYEVKINKKLVKRKNAANMAAYPFINLDDPKIYAKFLKSRKSEEYREKLRQKKLGKKLSNDDRMWAIYSAFAFRGYRSVRVRKITWISIIAYIFSKITRIKFFDTSLLGIHYIYFKYH